MQTYVTIIKPSKSRKHMEYCGINSYQDEWLLVKNMS